MLPLWLGLSESSSFERSARFLLSNGLSLSGASEGAATAPATGEESFCTDQAMGVRRLLWISLDCFRWMVAHRASNSVMARQNATGVEGAPSLALEGGGEGVGCGLWGRGELEDLARSGMGPL